jgi:hypothetical protein
MLRAPLPARQADYRDFKSLSLENKLGAKSPSPRPFDLHGKIDN